MVTLTDEQWQDIQALIEASQHAYKVSAVIRYQNEVMTRQNAAMVALKRAADKALTIEPRPAVGRRVKS